METVSYVAGLMISWTAIGTLSGALLGFQQHFVRQYHCRKGKGGAFQHAILLEVILVVILTGAILPSVVGFLLATYALAVDRELMPLLMKFAKTLIWITTGVTLFSGWTIFWKKAPFNRPVSR